MAAPSGKKIPLTQSAGNYKIRTPDHLPLRIERPPAIRAGNYGRGSLQLSRDRLRLPKKVSSSGSLREPRREGSSFYPSDRVLTKKFPVSGVPETGNMFFKK